MILQDDIVPCTGFLDAARAAVAARPNRLLAFFVAGVPLTYARAVFESCARDWPWAVLTSGTWCPAIANVWPVEMVRSFLAYADTRPFPAHFTADDEIIGRYLTHSGQTALASVPSLVEHPDVTASMVGRRALAGHDTGRIAACLIDDDCDARLIDWTAGPG